MLIAQRYIMLNLIFNRTNWNQESNLNVSTNYWKYAVYDDTKPFRSLYLSLPGTFAPWPFLLPGAKVLWNYRSVELSFPGTFAPLMCISPFTVAVLNRYSHNWFITNLYTTDLAYT